MGFGAFFLPGKLCRVLTQTANLLSAIRFVLAAVSIAAFMVGDRRPEILGPIALVASISDFVDGRVARRMGSVDGFGRWLDGVADMPLWLPLSHARRQQERFRSMYQS
jgi:phosphatidylglycerophosphate synthase